MDESGFAIGQIEATRIIVRAEARAQWQAQPGRQEWVSVLECICADGSAIPPLVIFKGEQPLCAWIPNNIANNWRFDASPKGWTSNFHGLEWPKHCFEPGT